MALAEVLEDLGIDEISDDQDFMEAEYEAVRDYCKERGCVLNKEDLETVRARGLESSLLLDWTD